MIVLVEQDIVRVHIDEARMNELPPASVSRSKAGPALYQILSIRKIERGVCVVAWLASGSCSHRAAWRAVIAAFISAPSFDVVVVQNRHRNRSTRRGGVRFWRLISPAFARAATTGQSRRPGPDAIAFASIGVADGNVVESCGPATTMRTMCAAAFAAKSSAAAQAGINNAIATRQRAIIRLSSLYPCRSQISLRRGCAPNQNRPVLRAPQSFRQTPDASRRRWRWSAR